MEAAPVRSFSSNWRQELDQRPLLDLDLLLSANNNILIPRLYSRLQSPRPALLHNFNG